MLKFEKKVVSSGQPEEEGDVQGALRVLPPLHPGESSQPPSLYMPQLPRPAVQHPPEFSLPQNSKSFPSNPKADAN